MAQELPPGTPEVTDTVLIADLLQFLSIRGSLGRLPLADVVVPVISVGDVRPTAVITRPPDFRAQDIFSNGHVIGPGASGVLADTGQLAAGTYDVGFHCAGEPATFNVSVNLEHRNAANAANLAVWGHLLLHNAANNVVIYQHYTFGYQIGANERLRAVTDIATGAGSDWLAVIFARIRT